MTQAEPNNIWLETWFSDFQDVWKHYKKGQKLSSICVCLSQCALPLPATIYRLQRTVQARNDANHHSIFDVSVPDLKAMSNQLSSSLWKEDRERRNMCIGTFKQLQDLVVNNVQNIYKNESKAITTLTATVLPLQEYGEISNILNNRLIPVLA